MLRGRWLTLAAGVVALPVFAAAPELGAPAGAGATASIGPRADRHALPVGPFTADENPVLELRGSVIWSAYRLDDREATVAAVAEAYRLDLRELGLETLLDCADRACGGFDFRFGINILPAPAMRMDVQNFVQLSARTESGDAYASVLISRVLGAVYIQIVTVEPSETAVAIEAAPKPEAGLDEVKPIRPVLTDLMAELRRDGHVQLAGVEFETGGSQLSAASAPALDQVAEMLKENKGFEVEIVGHSDNVGGVNANITLSRNRATAVLEALVERGVSRDRMEAWGVGYLSPLVSNETSEGKARNRRVEIVLAN